MGEIIKYPDLFILLFLNLVCLPAPYEDKQVFVSLGADLKMTCNGPPNAFSIKWVGDNDTTFFVCPSERYGSCEDNDGHSLDGLNSSTSTFTIENVSLQDARQYVCTIRPIIGMKIQCRFNMTIKGAYTMYFLYFTMSRLALCFTLFAVK